MNRDEPFGLPRGTVRGILTILVVVFAGLTMFVPIASGAGDARVLFVGAAAMVVRDYFAQREQVKRDEQDGRVLPPPSFGDED